MDPKVIRMNKIINFFNKCFSGNPKGIHNEDKEANVVMQQLMANSLSLLALNKMRLSLYVMIIRNVIKIIKI